MKDKMTMAIFLKHSEVLQCLPDWQPMIRLMSISDDQFEAYTRQVQVILTTGQFYIPVQWMDHLALDEVYRRTQNLDRPWHPNQYRSMSVGDLILKMWTDETGSTGKWFITMPIGFREINIDISEVTLLQSFWDVMEDLSTTIMEV